jgi:hypothetical protein
MALFWFAWCAAMLVCMIWMAVGLWDDWAARRYRARHPYLTRRWPRD